MEIDFYEVLQVSPRAETEVIEAAYKRLALKYHPDHNKAADAPERMKALNQAYAVLKDPTERARYDRKRQTTAYASTPTPRPAPRPTATARPTPRPPAPPPSPPPKPPTETHYAPGTRDVFVSEALVNDSIEMLKEVSVLRVAELVRRLGIGEPRAERLFNVLVARGIIDRNGRRIGADAQKGADPKGSNAAAGEELSSLVPEVLRLLRTEKTISVSLLEEKFRIGFARASALYQLVVEQEIVDKLGRPTATTKARLATKDLGPVFDCPFCGQASVHHYQTQKRLRPDTHYFKCPNCLTEFEQTGEGLYKIVQTPAQYAAIGANYKNRSFSPSQWKIIKKAEKTDQ